MKKHAMTAVLVAAMGASATASAQSAYIGANIGVTGSDFDCTGASSCDKSGLGLKLIGGYKLNKSFAVEGGYLDFGKITARGVISGTNVSTTVKPSAFVLSGAAMGPLGGNWVGVARFGVASTRLHIDATAGSLSGSDSETHTSPYFGLGFGYAITPATTVGLDADFTRSTYSGESLSVRMLTAALTYSF